MTAHPDDRPRLSTRTLRRAATGGAPAYDRSGDAAIAHLGFGAFARAHLGVYADDLSRGGRPTLIRGVSLHSRRVTDELAPQDFLYTVAEREPDRAMSLRVVGSVSSVESGLAAALDAVSAPSTRLVTLTITEKGYDLTDDDLARPDRPTSALGVLALALGRCRESGAPPPVIASLDNLLDNGAVLRNRVEQIALRLDPALPAWMADEVRFPNSVVDRMVPATTGRDLDEIGDALGLVDRAAVTTEHHRSWVTDTAGWPPLAEAGVEMAQDVAPFERRKLWLLNGPHSALAYGGLLAGCPTIASAVGHRVVSAFVRGLVDDIVRVAGLPPTLHAEDFAANALRRFGNPRLGHTCAQVGADGSRKLPQRFKDIVAARSQRGLDTDRFAAVVAIWLAMASGLEVLGGPLPVVEDPAGPRLRQVVAGDPGRLAQAALGPEFEPVFVAAVGRALGRLRGLGLALVEDLA